MQLRTLTILLAAGLVFAACGNSDDSASADSVDSATTATADSTEDAAPDATEAPEATAAPETTAAPDTTSAPETTAAGDGSCLVGSWVIDEDEMNAYYDALATDTAAGADAFDIDIVGQVTLDLDGENYVYGAGFTLEIDAGGLTGEGVSTGGVTGTYTAVDGVITTELGSSDLDVTIEVGGISLSGSDLANGLLTDLPINNAPFDCEGPTIGFQSGADPSVRHDVLLKPA